MALAVQELLCAEVCAEACLRNGVVSQLHSHLGSCYGVTSVSNIRKITWRRCVDMNDRQLRNVVDGLGGKTNGMPREDGYDITVASEIMAVLCLANDITDLKPFTPNTGPRDGSRSATITFLPSFCIPSARPTVVVVLPSPAGVGLIAVTRISSTTSPLLPRLWQFCVWQMTSQT